MNFLQTGVPTPEMIRAKFPTNEQLKGGRCAVAECYQKIPCNPCESSCPFGAITVGEDINNTPTVDFSLCRGCGICLTKCPGLAIMLATLKDGEAELSVPYEFLPLPVEGDYVNCLDREGAFVCRGLVASVRNPENFDRTPIVAVRFDEEHLYSVRNIDVEAER